MNRDDLLNQIKILKNELEKAENALKDYHPTLAEASPGDVLEDGCIVIEKYNNAALIAAPENTQVSCTWSKEFSPVFDKLIQEGFNPSQWFIPNPKQLIKAYKVAKQHFPSTNYWSSTEASSTNACFVHFSNGSQNIYSKTNSDCVRAFSLVEF